jgi:CHAT domain-containing protein
MWGILIALFGARATSAGRAVMRLGFLFVVLVVRASGAHAQLECSQPGGASAYDLVQLADCYRTTNQMVRSLDALNRALEASSGAAGDAAETIAIHARLAAVLGSLGEYQDARDSLLRGIAVAETAHLATEAAPLLNDLGGVLMATGEALAGLAAFADSYRLAPESSALRVTAGINLVRALDETAAARNLSQRLELLRGQALALDATAGKATALLGLASLYRELSLQASRAEYEARAEESATAALELARELGDQRLVSTAYNELANWHFAHAAHARALAFAREATLAAQAAGATESLYRAEWTTGRVLRAMGRRDDARVAYGSAVDTLSATQSALATSARKFQNDVLPLYSEYADVMFAAIAGMSTAARRDALVEVQQTLERLRLAEVVNYFENQCAAPEVVDVRAAESDDAVVIYPVLFPDRTELLVSTKDDLFHFTADVGVGELTAETQSLRAALEDAASGSAYLAPAQQIYHWLIDPLLPVIEAASPDVLVFVPEGPLRTIPLAVLHDGERFLIERHALASTPGLSLIAATKSQTVDRVLASGLIDAVQGFPPLPFVEAELRSISERFPAAVYADEAFLSDTLRREILQGGYTIVHLATHAQFDADYKRSFLLTHDDLITMDELEDVMSGQRYSARPVDLLVLSACQTAAGDERAALGLAGVAVKAGAKSALASLWHINDESTSVLIAEFYRQLANEANNKSAALRGAQLLLMNDARYRHPAYWAPFLLIGDWR